MNQRIFFVQNGLPSSLNVRDKTFSEREQRTSSFLGHLRAHLPEPSIKKASVTTDDRQEEEWSRLTDLLEANNWEEVPEALELLALLQDESAEGDILPVNLTDVFGGEPGESIEAAIRALEDLAGLDGQGDLQVYPPNEKSIETLVLILQQSLSISSDRIANGKIEKPLQMILKWGHLIKLTYGANEPDGQSKEAKDRLAKVLEQWKEKIPSLIGSADQAGKEQKLQLSSPYMPVATADSIFGLKPSGIQELPVNQTMLVGDLQINDSQTLVVSKNGQVIESDEFMKQWESLMMKAKFTSVNGLQRLQIQLAPENLGALHIQMSKKDGQILATIVASTQQGKEILESHLHSLKTTLTNQGIQLDRILLQDSQAIFDEQLKDQQRQKEEPQEQLEEKEDAGFASFLDELQELLINETI